MKRVILLRLRIAGSRSNPSGCSPAAEVTTGGPNVETGDRPAPSGVATQNSQSDSQ